jgi:Sulfotransferase family
MPSRLRQRLYWTKVRLLPYGVEGLWRRPVHRARWRLRSHDALEGWVDRRLALGEGYWLFLLGVSNSGTTILTRLLASHPELRVLPKEGQALTDAVPSGSRYGVGRRWTERMDLFHLTEESDPAPALRAKYDWAYHFDRRPGILVEKSPPNAVRARWLQANFRPARFLAITRHPYAVCEGMRRRSNATIEGAARQWATANEVMLTDAERLEHFLLISYEELTERTGETLERMHAFLGLEAPFDRSVAERPLRMANVDGGPRPLQNFNSKSLERLTDDEIAVIDRIAGPMMERLGYVPLERPAPAGAQA